MSHFHNHSMHILVKEEIRFDLRIQHSCNEDNYFDLFVFEKAIYYEGTIYIIALYILETFAVLLSIFT